MKRINSVKKGSESFQNKYEPFSAVQRKGQKSKGSSQHLTASWFYKSLPNTEEKNASIFQIEIIIFGCRLWILEQKK